MAEEFQEGQSNDTMFQDAVDALRRGDKPRAKELLMLLLKADQNNPTYWIWLSASMESSKEQIYCLQTAIKLDPENSTAKRGLILLGALTPTEVIPPFVVNRPRAWEQKLLLANERPREKGFKAFANNPATRLVSVIAVGVVLVAIVLFGFVLPNQTTKIATRTFTPGPSPTFTTTPTVFGAVVDSTKQSLGPTPLWMMLPQTYTPTAMYVNTPRAGQSIDQYRSAKDAYAKGDWDSYIANMKLIIPMEPDAADVHYLIGEAYRFKEDSKNAKKSYNDALKIDPDFAAPYLGLARVRLADEPNVNVEFLFDEIFKRDSDFGEAYIERAHYFLFHKKPKDAIEDLDRASELLPSSPEVYATYANAYMALGDSKNALKSVEKAYSLDITSVPIYKLLGELYIENKQYDRAIEALNVFVTYETEDDEGLALLGKAYFNVGDYKAALENLNKAMKINRNGLRKFYIYRGLSNLELKHIDQAVSDLEIALGVDGKSFEVNLGLTRAYYLQEKYGSAYLRAEALKSLAQTNQQKAQSFYWHALIQEMRDQRKEAAKDWQALLALGEKATTPEIRAEAEKHLKSMLAFTLTPKPASPTPTATGYTPTPTSIKSGTRTPIAISGTSTPTPKGGTVAPAAKSGTGTPTPTVTFTPTPTLMGKNPIATGSGTASTSTPTRTPLTP